MSLFGRFRVQPPPPRTSRCGQCGTGGLPDGQTLCAHHLVTEDDWARANRIWCDFLHRHRLPRRLTHDERVAAWLSE